jgi:hypothetical protein
MNQNSVLNENLDKIYIYIYLPVYTEQVKQSGTASYLCVGSYPFPNLVTAHVKLRLFR